MTDTRERDIIRAFVDLSHELVDDYDVLEMLDRLLTHCVDLLDVASAGLLLADPHGDLHLAAATSEVTRDLELLQLQGDQGPCLDCFRGGAPVLVPDLQDTRDRWPAFAPTALQAGLVSVHALPLRLRDSMIGTLGLFGIHAGRLSDDDVALAQSLVDIAGLAIVNERAAADREALGARLQDALDSRVVVEQAKGVIAHAGGLDMAAAYDVLRSYARQSRLRLTHVATRVVDRDLPSQDVLAVARR